MAASYWLAWGKTHTQGGILLIGACLWLLIATAISHLKLICIWMEAPRKERGYKRREAFNAFYDAPAWGEKPEIKVGDAIAIEDEEDVEKTRSSRKLAPRANVVGKAMRDSHRAEK